VDIAAYIDAVREQGSALADAASLAGLDAAVPTCPDWQVKDLLRHTGYVHRWAARHITEQPPAVLDGPSEAEILSGGAPDDELIGWFRAGHAALTEALACADPDVRAPAFMATAPTPLGFWARRQAHETAIHRVDADCALGVLPVYPAAFAVDGIDELVTGFGARRRYQPAAGSDGLAIVASDTGSAWLVSSAEGRSVASPAAPSVAGACTVTGRASDVYLFLWNRSGSGVTVTGDRAVLDCWKSAVRVRW
jgi:uncharacterized protein (TIGR03083 family)